VRPWRNSGERSIPTTYSSLPTRIPSLPVGAQIPPIRALYQGEEITDIDQFIRDKGAVFLANRSVDW
jgi:hypothetical protein